MQLNDKSSENLEISSLLSISPIDGRYYKKNQDLRPLLSEYGLIKHRLIIEIKWLQHLSTDRSIIDNINHVEVKEELNLILDKFDIEEAKKIKTIEGTTNHDVKAVEYYLRNVLQARSKLKKLSNYVHFGCTSEDINNLAYGLMISKARNTIIIPSIDKLLGEMKQIAHDSADIAMLSRTHGQAATPTTLGKEIANFCYRLEAQKQHWEDVKVLGKLNGAVGNFNALVCTFPGVDWEEKCKLFIEQLGLSFNQYTTQIEPHDCVARYSNELSLINSILIDFCQDIWTYISLNYFKQKVKKDEVGSSTMPHKVNPIDFENAEGNSGVSICLLKHFGQKLVISRLQRDLSDSTVMRNLGVAIAHTYLAIISIQTGLKKLQINKKAISEDLIEEWQLLSEPIQTILRTHGVDDAYEKLKHLSRGKNITKENLFHFLDGLDLPAETIRQLKALTPSSYIGLAAKLAKQI
ncbi:MAG: adenylosuccinate lyase [Methylococcaceae bacterium TMED69]|mgnify:CR=1 FL=1|nr:MAG: adenylosuccinate lyase [Methylococcaceae bacterium TMED69]